MDTNIGNITVEFDISATETPDFQELCVLSLGYDNGANMDTWNDLCNAHSNSVVTSLDESWSFSHKFNKTDAVALFLKAKKFAVGSDREVDIKITDKLEGKVIAFTACIGSINYSYENDSVLEIEYELKIADNSTFSEVDYTA